MNNQLVESLRRWGIFLGVAQILFGCIIGMLPPSSVLWFRGIVMAHIEYTANGVMMVVLALLLREMKLNKIGLYSWFISLQLGTWLNGTSGIVAAITGKSAVQTSNMASTNPPPFGMGNPVASLLLIVTSIACLIALFLSVWGLIKGSLMKKVA